MVKLILEKLISKTSLTESESYDFMKSVMMGEVTDIQLSGVLIALRLKKENSDEVTGFARAMREKMIKIDIEHEAMDVAAFLMWTAEPKMMARQHAGFVGVLMLSLLAALLYLTNKRIWAPIKKKSKQA